MRNKLFKYLKLFYNKTFTLTILFHIINLSNNALKKLKIKIYLWGQAFITLTPPCC